MFGYVFHNKKCPKSWRNFEDPMVPLERNLYGHPLVRLLWKRQFEEALLELGWEEVPKWECMFAHRKQRVISVSFCGGCTQRECKQNETIIEQYTKMFESRLCAGAKEKLPGRQKPHTQTVAWSYHMEGHAQKCVERYCELANNKVEQPYKVSHPCLDDHRFKKEELESVEELSEVCSQIVLKCVCLERIGRPDILWSVNKLARSVTKWTQPCDKRLARLITCIHHTNDYRQYCHVGNKLRFRTVLQNLKSFRWMLDYVWMGYLLLIFVTS